MITFELLFAGPESPLSIHIEGHPEDPAHNAIMEALGRAGSRYDGVTGFALITREQYLRDRSDPLQPDGDFLLLDADTTLADLRLAVGPSDDAVVLRPAGFGGGAEDFLLWVINDLLPIPRTMLEVYGAAEFVRAVGLALRARKHRETREVAKYWALSGRGIVPDLLQEAIVAESSWSLKRANDTFGLERFELGELMRGCDYEYNPVNDSFAPRSGASI